MVFEQYRFTRYYLPGCLFIVYVSLLLISATWPISWEFFRSDLRATVTFVVGVFVISPPIGYLLYSFYDWQIYNEKALDWKNRPSLEKIFLFVLNSNPNTDNNGGEENNLYQRAKNLIEIYKQKPHLCKKQREKEAKKLGFHLLSLETYLKELIDYLIAASSNTIGNTIRGFWNNYAGRKVSSTIVPLFAFITTFLIILIDVIASHVRTFLLVFPISNIPFSLQLTGFSIIGVSIVLVSISLYLPTDRPRLEAFALEFYTVCDSLEKITENMKVQFQTAITLPRLNQ